MLFALLGLLVGTTDKYKQFPPKRCLLGSTAVNKALVFPIFKYTYTSTFDWMFSLILLELLLD
jgi:hypothetical protein